MPEVTSVTVTENTLYNITITETAGTTVTVTVPGIETIINTSLNEIDAVMQNNGAGKGVYKVKDNATFVMRSINDDDKTIDVDYANSDNEVKIKLPDAGISTPDGFTINADSDNTAKIELPGSTVDLSKAKLLTDLDAGTKDLDNVGTVNATDIAISNTAMVTGDFQIGSTMSVYGTAVFNADSHMSSGKRFSTDKLTVGSTATINSADISTVDINNGTIDGTTIGASTSSTGRFTTVDTTSLTAATADINAGSIDNTTVGATSSSTGRFTTLESAQVDINGGAIDGVIIGGSAPGTIVTTDLTATTVDINGGNIDGTIIGATQQRALHTSDLTADTADINAGTIDATTIGANTPSTIVTTGLTATTVDINAGTIDATEIGATTPVVGTFTTANATVGAITTVNSTNVNSTNLDVDTGTIDNFTTTTIGGTTGNLTTVNSTNVNSTNLDVDTGTIDTFTSTTAGITTVNATDVNATGTGTIGTLNVTGNTTLAGDLTVNGTTTTVNTETINLADNNILLNSNHTGTPTEDSGITINRGTEIDSEFHWNEASDRWQANYLQQYTTVTAGSFVIGNSYTILTHGTTTENNWNQTAGTPWGTPRPIGSTFTATNDTGLGTGTATYTVPLVYADLKVNNLDAVGDVTADDLTVNGTLAVQGTFVTNQDLITANNIVVSTAGNNYTTGIVSASQFTGTFVGGGYNHAPVGSRVNSTGGEFTELQSMQETEFCIHSGDVGIGCDDAYGYNPPQWGNWNGNNPANLNMNGFGSIVWPWSGASEGDHYASIGVPAPAHNYNEAHGGDMTITVPHGLLIEGFIQGYEMQVDGDLDVTGTVDANGGDFNALMVGSVYTDLLPLKANEVAHPHNPIVYSLGSTTKVWDKLYVDDIQTATLSATGLSSLADINASGDILPTVDNTQYLGSATKRWHSLHLGPGSLYIDGHKVLGSDAEGQIDITTDTDQSLNINAGAAGTAGDITLSSAGNTTTINDTTINLGPSVGGGTINARGTLEAPDLHIGDLEFASNKIDSTATNGNLEIATNGTGYLHANVADLYVGPITGAVKIDESSISVSNTDGDLNLTSNGTGAVTIDELSITHGTYAWGETYNQIEADANRVLALKTTGSGYIYNVAPTTWFGDNAGAYFQSNSGAASTLKPFGGQALHIGPNTSSASMVVTLEGDVSGGSFNGHEVVSNKDGLTIPGVPDWGGFNFLTGGGGVKSATTPNTGYPIVGIQQTASGQSQPEAAYFINNMDYDISGGLSGHGVQVKFAAQDETGKLIDIAANLCKIRNETVSGSAGSSTVDTWDSEYTLTVTSNAGSGANNVGTNTLTTNVDFTEVSQELRVVDKPGNSGNTSLSGLHLVYDGAETGTPSAKIKLRDEDGGTTTNLMTLETDRVSHQVIQKQYKASSDPTGEAGDTYFNTTTSKFMGYNGSAWVELG